MTMRLETLVKEFDKYFFNMMYDESMQVVGKMYASNHTGQARYCEMLIYYEEGKFEKIRNRLKNKKLEKIEERELYLCSLLELQLYDEFYKAYQSPDVISVSCVQYIGALMISQGNELEKVSELGTHRATPVDTYMSRRFRWYVANTFADIYNINEEKLQMKEALMNPQDISYLDNLLTRKFESIRIHDPFREEIIQQVESNTHIDKEKVLWFPIAYCGKRNKSGTVNVIQGFDNLFDIVHYLDVCKKINYNAVELDEFVKYGKQIFDAVRDGNTYVIDFVKRLYIDISFYRRYEINENKDTLADVILNCLTRYAPYVIDDIDNHVNDRKIYDILSKKGKFAYKAALWQFEHAMNANYGTTDAGMLCLSYMRILELEINERIITNLVGHIEEIREDYNAFINMFDGEDEREKHRKTWGYVINVLTEKLKKESLELGPIYAVLDILRERKFKKSNPDYQMSNKLRAYFDQLLTAEGRTALQDGVLADMVKPKVREKFRNPPAHTRYVRLETALECREYVENNLILLNRYIV